MNTFLHRKCMKICTKMHEKTKFWAFQKAFIFAIQVAIFGIWGVILMAKWYKKAIKLGTKKHENDAKKAIFWCQNGHQNADKMMHFGRKNE